MTTITERPDLPAARRHLTAAVHALIGRTTTYLHRDEGDGPRVVWGDSRYQQLVDYTPGGAGATGTSVPRSVPPIALDAVSLVDQIDRAVREWQPDPGIFDGDLGQEPTPETVRRLHLIDAYSWRPEDVEPMEAMTRQLCDWAARIDRLLDPPRDVTIAAPCPACGVKTVYRQDSAGENVRTPALHIGPHGCECLACHHVWAPDLYAHLARTLGTMPEGVLE